MTGNNLANLTRPLGILVSNDDGILSPGLLALAQTMREFGQVTVIGPEENQSANGHRKTLYKPLRVNEVNLGEGITAYSTDGAPADCVALAMLGIVKDPIDLVVSGINRGTNLGQDLTYSGTLAAAFEGTIYRKPSIAFSLDNRVTDADFSTATEFIRRIVRQVIAQGLPVMTLLNVNIPNLPLEAINGVQITRQGTSVYHDELIARVDPSGRPYYWIGGDVPGGDVTIKGTDMWAVKSGYVSITPIQLDITAHTMINELQGWSF